MSEQLQKSKWITYKIPRPIILAFLWAAVLFFYIYADILTFYEPGILQQIMSGRVAGFEVTQGFLFSAGLLMTLPMIMLILSLLLPSRINRILNMILSSLHILLAIAVLFTPGETWYFYLMYTMLEITCHGLIFWFSLKWPRNI